MRVTYTLCLVIRKTILFIIWKKHIYLLTDFQRRRLYSHQQKNLRPLIAYHNILTPLAIHVGNPNSLLKRLHTVTRVTFLSAASQGAFIFLQALLGNAQPFTT